MHAKHLTILAIITLLMVLVTAIIVSQNQQKTPTSSTPLVFPSLAEKVNEVATIHVATKADHFTLVKGDKYWGLQEKHQYPVNMDKVSQLVLGLSALKILEAKTANPELYSKLGVEDITAEDAQSVLFTLKDSADQTLASLIVGNHQIAKIDATQREFYLRKAEDKQTWLAIGTLPVDKQPTQWLDKQILDIESARVQQVKVIHPEGEQVLIFRDTKDNEDYQLADLSAHMKIKSMYTLKQLAGTLADLQMHDVTIPSEVTFSQDAHTQAVFTTFDGLEITITLVEQEDKYYTQLTAAFVPEAIVGDTKENSTETDSTAKVTHTPEQVKAEAETLQSKLKGWVFEVPSYKTTALLKRQAELVEAPAEEVGNVTTGDPLFIQPIEEMGHESTTYQLNEALGHPVTVQ